MRKFLLIAASVIVIALTTVYGMFWSWCQIPVPHANQVNQIRKGIRAEIKAVKQLGRGQNAYVDVAEIVSDPVAGGPYLELGRLATDYRDSLGSLVETLGALQRDRAGELKAAEKRFASILPRLREMAAKPHFAVVRDVDTVPHFNPNLAWWDSFHRSLAAYGYLQLQAGKPEVALDCAMIGLKWSRNSIGHGPLGQLGIALRSLRLHSELALLLVSSERLAPAALGRLKKHALELVPPLEDYRGSIDYEFEFCFRILEIMQSWDLGALGPVDPANRLPYVPAFLRKPFVHRELAILSNTMMWVRSSLGQARYPSSGFFVPGYERDFVCRYMLTGPANEFLPRLFREDRSRLNGIAIACALQIHKAKHGDYPDLLTSLVPEALPRLPLPDLDPCLGYRYEPLEKGMSLAIDSPELDKSLVLFPFVLEPGLTLPPPAIPSGEGSPSPTPSP